MKGKSKINPVVHLVSYRRADQPLREVPDCKRPLHLSPGKNPGGLPPAPIKPGWNTFRGRHIDWEAARPGRSHDED